MQLRRSNVYLIVYVPSRAAHLVVQLHLTCGSCWSGLQISSETEAAVKKLAPRLLEVNGVRLPFCHCDPATKISYNRR